MNATGLPLVGKDEYVVTEAGFGANIGLEKFFNIKCRYSGLKPNAAVVVCTVRALKMHGGGPTITPGVPLPKEYTQEDTALVEKGTQNLVVHIKNCKKFNINVVVAINKFNSDTDKEIAIIKQKAIEAGAESAVLSTHWAEGGKGAVDLANALIEACEKQRRDGLESKFLYEPEKLSVKEKIETIAMNIYGAAKVTYTELAEEKINIFTKWGYDKMPICMAKTPLSLCHDPNVKGAPTGFDLPIIDLRVSVGAGFLLALCGEIRTIPGLPTRPNFYDIDIDENGNIIGLS